MRARRSPLGAVTIVAGLALAACGDDGGSAERFCGEIDENRALLTDPALVYSDDIEPLLDMYRDIADLAPLAIETEWRQLLATYETADTVVLGDPESEQTALAAAFQSEPSARAVADWLRANCAVDIGPLATIVPPEVPTTVVAEVTEESPPPEE